MLVLPPDRKEISGPLIFLAGPIQGAHDWHEEAIKYFEELAPSLWVACPKRLEDLDGADFGPEKYAEQVDWETEHLRRAAKEGVVMFWLGKEKTHNCARAFGQTTRFELGEWKERHLRDGSKLVVGIEEGWTGGRYVRRRFAQDCPDVPICTTLRETCEAAARLAANLYAPAGVG